MHWQRLAEEVGAAALFAGALGLANVPAAAADAAVAVEIGTFVNTTYIAVAPGRPNHLFVVERRGRIQILENEPSLPDAFLDIEDVVLGKPDAGALGEQGLFSVAFAPDYEDSGLFYVAFTNDLGDIELDEFQRALPGLVGSAAEIGDLA